MTNLLSQETVPVKDSSVITATETPSTQEIHANAPKPAEDPVHQYVRPISYPTGNAYANNYYKGYPYAPNVPLPQYLPPANVPPENVVYEGVLVPMMFVNPTRSQQQQQQTKQVVPQSGYVNLKPDTMNKSNSNFENKISANRNSFDLAVILQALLPPNIIHIVITIGNFILNSLSTIAFASAVTSALCSLTPICTLSFGILPWSVRQIFVARMTDNDDDDVTVTTIQRARRAADLFSNALDKYEKLQRGVESLTKSLENAQKKSRARKSFEWLSK